MSFFKPIWQIFISIWQWLKTNYWNVLLVIFIALGIVGGIDGYFYCKAIGHGRPISLAEFEGGILGVIGILMLSKRTFNQDRQIQFQVDKEVDDRFTSAVTLLGSDQTSARTGALYVLYDLAIKNDKYRKQVAEIMCAHVRGHTQMPEYKKENKEKPSDEIQTAINLLFKDMNGTKGIYCQDFAKNLSDADLSYSFLIGADFRHAHCDNVNFRSAECQVANFSYAKCQGAYFSFAQCQGANFRDAHCQRSDFIEAKCQGAYFLEAQCQGAYFRDAQCQGAYFIGAQCQGAHFIRAQCQDAHFISTKCQGAHFTGAQCQGADFEDALCQGADFILTRCQGADFRRAQCQGANFNKAQCQGATFKNTQCQGAIAKGSALWRSLSSRIGESTAIENAVFAGGLEADWLDKLQSSVEICGSAWFEKMKKIHEEHSKILADNTLPKGIIQGELEDTEEIQKIIAEITKIRLSMIDK